MSFFNWFKKKSSIEVEDELAEQAIRENEELMNEAEIESSIPATIIRYFKEDDDAPPSIEILSEDFHGPVLPETGSIIWIKDDDTRTTRPYKCIRYDYFESDDEYERSRCYIVVEAAKSSDIMPNPKFVAS